MPELFSQPDFQSFGFGASLDRVVSLVEPSFQPEAQPLAPPFTALPEIAGSLVANLVLSKSLLRSKGGLTDIYVRVLRIESESSLIRNLNHVNAVHVRSPGRSRSVGMGEAATYPCMTPVSCGAADLLETATTRTTARTTALTRAYPAVGSLRVANTYAMANRVLTSAFIEATTTRRTAARPTVTVSLLYSIGRLL